ncbi:type IV pilus modification PilV family protein [Planctellipticum variicoloris]|uniref:type IV pilus modification PilV family protein n=1 Tax=Planctellipticum variicoloris TaxID=3064265 RepID=UPI0030140B84|nr:hypothetical protein SH412_000614 [Planctomycetaceae bacterium SH412]
MNPLRQTLSRTAGRPGVTLSEVLVSLLVMSIGVISLATLFPIATLRMIQATQLTQSTQLRYNAEALTHAQPALLNGAPAWQASTIYNVGDVVIPSVKSTQYYVCSSSSSSNASGLREPQWRTNIGATTTDNDVEWTTRQCRVYMIDPLGWEERSEEMSGLGLAPQPFGVDYRNTFGRVAPNSIWPPAWRPALVAESPYRMVRFRGTAPHNFSRPVVESTPALQAARRRLARLAGMSLDSFQLQAESTDLDTAAFTTDGQGRLTGIAMRDLPAGLSETILPADLASGAVEGRVTLFDTTGRFSEVRQIQAFDDSNPNQQRIVFGDPATGQAAPLDWNKPPFYVTALGTPVIGRVVIETREQRFSWMLACRISGGTTYASVVCFFKRGFGASDELIHPAHFANRLPGGDGIWGNFDDILNNNRVVVQTNPAAIDPPFLKRGGYVCDAQNNRWYRITSYEEVTDALQAQQNMDGNFPNAQLAAAPGAILTLETPILENSGYYVKGANPVGPGGVMLMPGVIDVYPLDPSLPWEEN